MIRKLLMASLSVVALSAGAAAVASTANAETFQAGAYPATVTGKATKELTISNGTRTISCANASLSGQLLSSSEELQLTSALAECTGIGVYVRLTGEGPKLDVHFLRWTFIIPDYFIKLTAPTWKWDIWFTEAESKAEKPPLCSYEAPELGNAAVETMTGTNEGTAGARHMSMEINSSNLLIKRTAGTEALCGKEKQTEGTVTGKFNLTASKEGKEVGLWFE